MPFDALNQELHVGDLVVVGRSYGSSLGIVKTASPNKNSIQLVNLYLRELGNFERETPNGVARWVPNGRTHIKHTVTSCYYPTRLIKIPVQSIESMPLFAPFIGNTYQAIELIKNGDTKKYKLLLKGDG